MPDGTASVISMVWDVVKWLWFALAGLLMYNGKKIINDVDKIKEDYVKEDTFNETLGSLRKDIKDVGDKHEESTTKLRDDLREDYKAVHSRIDTLLIRTRTKNDD